MSSADPFGNAIPTLQRGSQRHRGVSIWGANVKERRREMKK